MRNLLLLALIAAGSTLGGCHWLIHHRLHHVHRYHRSHHTHVVVRPRPVYVVKPAPKPASEPSAPKTKTKVLLPHEWLAKRHRAHMDAIKGD